MLSCRTQCCVAEGSSELKPTVLLSPCHCERWCKASLELDWILHESKVLSSPCLNVLNSVTSENSDPEGHTVREGSLGTSSSSSCCLSWKVSFPISMLRAMEGLPKLIFFFFFLWWLLYPLATQAYFLIELDPSNFQTKWISEVPKDWTLWKIHRLHVVTEGIFLLSQLHSEYWNVIFTTNAVFPDGFFFRFARHSQKDTFLLLKNFFELEIN